MEVKSRSLGAMFPEYLTEASRVKTFDSWPSDSHLQPRDLAEAGFFYEGDKDTVKCYCCGVVLYQWTSEDRAWTEHERWKPSCYHVLLYKEGCFRSGDECEGFQSFPVQASGVDSDDMLPSSAALHQAFQNRVEPIPDGPSGTKNGSGNNSSFKDHDVMEELQRLRQQFLCKTCFKEKACMVILPCTHLSTCPACVEKLQNCNVCHQPIKATIRAYCA